MLHANIHSKRIFYFVLFYFVLFYFIFCRQYIVRELAEIVSQVGSSEASSSILPHLLEMSADSDLTVLQQLALQLSPIAQQFWAVRFLRRLFFSTMLTQCIAGEGCKKRRFDK